MANLESGKPDRRFPVPVVCPACLATLNDEWHCTTCGRTYALENGFPNLILGERFDDPTDQACMDYEEQSNADLTRNYWLPMFRRFWPGGGARLLSLGCGTGVDVDLLADAGFDTVGIDCGNRTHVWPRRRYPERFLLANGKHLPFPDAIFDGVYCGCVFPHVGVIGDSDRVAPDYRESRAALAQQMARVLRPGGKILVSSPNRWFPFDIFHGRRPGSYTPRFNPPTSPFLLSVGDYRRLFRAAGCVRVEAQPVRGYWGFIRSARTLKGRLLGLPVRFLFWLASLPGAKPLRSWPLNPWLVVLIEKGT